MILRNHTKFSYFTDSNGPKRAAGSNEKATHGYEYWEQKKVNRWFCNQPLSPVQNDDPPQVHVLQNIIVVPGHSKQDGGDVNVPKCTNGRDDTEHVQSGGEISTNKITVKKLKNFCYYCETDVTNFARHITNNHSHEIEVIKLNSLPLKSVERKRLLAELRNKGNYLNSANCCPRRVCRACIPDTPVLPCDNCLGFFSSKLLHRHRKRCGTKRSGRAQSEGQTILVHNMRVDERLRREVFPRMRADKISLEAKSDDLICAFGARYLSTHREKHFVTLTSLLLEIKKINPEVKCLFHALNPTNFDLFVQATQIVARYDPTKEKFEAPTFAMNILNSLKQCCDTAINFVLRGRHRSAAIPNAEAEVRFRTMIHLFQANWRFEVSSVAASNLNLNKWNKTTIIPLASDLKLLMIYLLDIAKQNIEKLQTDTRDATAYNNLVETIFCRVILLNKLRTGELQRMLLDIYMNCENGSDIKSEILFGGADVNVPNNTYTSPGSKKKKRILIPWTPEENKLAKQFFKGHSRCSKPPKGTSANSL
nr:unnamed protein product [Callosobruchus analis]